MNFLADGQYVRQIHTELLWLKQLLGSTHSLLLLLSSSKDVVWKWHNHTASRDEATSLGGTRAAISRQNGIKQLKLLKPGTFSSSPSNAPALSSWSGFPVYPDLIPVVNVNT